MFLQVKYNSHEEIFNCSGLCRSRCTPVSFLKISEMSIYSKYLGMALGLATLSQGDKLFSAGYSLDKPYFNPNYRRPSENKELREFNMKGKKIMAYSKKDAIKRLKHKK